MDWFFSQSEFHSIHLLQNTFSICLQEQWHSAHHPHLAKEIKWGKQFHLPCFASLSSKITVVHILILFTFNSFQNFSFGSLPINKEYIYSYLGHELMQKLYSLRTTHNKTSENYQNQARYWLRNMLDSNIGKNWGKG